MSTRAQVFMKNSGVYLYQHCDGYDIEKEVMAALKRSQERWDDEEYMARIIFCEMLRVNSKPLDDLTGYGIGVSQHGDIKYLVTVDCEQQKGFVDHGGERISEHSFEKSLL